MRSRERIDRKSEVIQVRGFNQNSDERYKVSTVEIDYEVGAEIS